MGGYRISGLVLALGLVIGLTACQSDGGPTVAGAGGSDLVPEATESLVPGAAETAAVVPPASTGPAPTAPATVEPSASAPGEPPASAGVTESPVRAVVTPACVRPADTVTLTIDAPRNAAVSMVVAYGKGRKEGVQSGELNMGTADAQGRYQWRFVVRADAVEGAAEVLVGSSGPDGAQEGKGYTVAPFTVDKRC